MFIGSSILHLDQHHKYKDLRKVLPKRICDVMVTDLTDPGNFFASVCNEGKYLYWLRVPISLTEWWIHMAVFPHIFG